MTELWASDTDLPEREQVLSSLKSLLGRLFPARPVPYAERQVIAERAAKTIYLHSHMDEETFDTDRIRQCCVTVPETDGTTVPTCSYNILYRERDVRFSAKHPGPLTDFTGGRHF